MSSVRKICTILNKGLVVATGDLTLFEGDADIFLTA